MALEVTVPDHSSIVAGPVVTKSVMVEGCDGAELLLWGQKGEEEGRQEKIRGEGGPALVGEGPALDGFSLPFVPSGLPAHWMTSMLRAGLSPLANVLKSPRRYTQKCT